MRLKLAILTLAAAIGWSVNASAITGDVPEFKKLADGVFAYVGKQNDANAMVIVTSEGVVLVDTGNNNSDSRALLKNIQAVTKEPVRYVVITQNHGDHIGGTPLFAPPAHVILQERVVKSWAAMKSYQINSWRKRFAERTDALKTVSPLDNVISFDSHMSLHLGGRDIELLYVEDIYNPGDVAVWLPKEGVLHASFAGYKDRHPDIRPDYSHGTTTGMLKQLEAYIALKPKIVVPAHGPLTDVAGLETVVDYLILARHKVRDMTDRGMALPAIEKAFNMNEYRDWDRTEHLSWTADTIYRELKGQDPLIVPMLEHTVRATISKLAEEGRFLTVTAASGEEVRLRISTETNFEGMADRSGLRVGMKVTALYQVPQGANNFRGVGVAPEPRSRVTGGGSPGGPAKTSPRG
jgi:cyclase